MNESPKRLEPPDLRSFHDNWGHFPADQLAPYYGQYVTWSPDGTRILACGATEAEMEQNLIALGIAPSQVVGEFIEPPGEGPG